MLRIIISPAKKMNVADDFPIEATEPQFLERTAAIRDYLQSLDYDTLKEIWKCNDTIAAQNVERLRDMKLMGRVTPAVIAYEGIQYHNMAPAVMELDQLAYIEEHLYILSGFYGILRAFDGVVPYRLEMQARLAWQEERQPECRDESCGENQPEKLVTSLYDYWGDRLARALMGPDPEHTTIINLASKEYSKAVLPWLPPEVFVVTCVFGEWNQGKVKVKATAAKMARGAMVRYMAEHQVTEVEQLKRFDRLGYRFLEERSDTRTLVFVAENGNVRSAENRWNSVK